MQTDPSIIKKQFKKSIDKYNKNAIVQEIIANKIAKYLNGNAYNAIMEIGAGSGLLTSKLATVCDYEEYWANDLVEKSEIYVKNYIPNATFLLGDFQKLKIDKKFDLVVSNAVFQWYENLNIIFKQCKNLLKSDGILAFSTFSPDNYKEIKSITGLSLKYKTQEEIINILKNNFEIIKVETSEHIINFDSPLKVLEHMKNTGVNSLSDCHWGIKEVKKFCDMYAKQFPNLTLTYSPIIVIAKNTS